MDLPKASSLRSNSFLLGFTRKQDSINLNSGEKIETDMVD
jgi:hypothetical protein